MGENAKKPAIRFAGFTDAWEQRKLSTICSMHARIGWQNLRTSEFLDTGDYYLITGTDFDNGRVNFGTCHYVDKSRYDQDTKIQVQNGSILITKDGTLGKVAFVEGLDKPATLNAGVFNLGITRDFVDNKYLFQYIKAPFLMDYVDKKATGGTIKHLNQNILVDFPVTMPKGEEQRLIGVYFEQLDNLITLHQRRYDKLVNIKKSMLEKMFPQHGADAPEIRFAEFTDSWGQKKIGDVYQKIRNAFVGTATPFYVEEGHFYLESNNIKDGQINRKSEIFINDKFYESQRGNWLHTEDIVMVQSGHVGHTAVIPSNFDNTAAHALIIIANPTEKISPHFVNYQFQTLYSKMRIDKITTGNTINHILSSSMKKFEIQIPTYEEQQKIYGFFHELDSIITLHQRRLEKLKNIKKSCLEKMFV